MKKQNLLFTSLLLFFVSGSVICMENFHSGLDIKTGNQSKELFMEFKSLLPELQQHILFSQEAITFLSEQPITLAGSHGHTDEIYSVVIAIIEDSEDVESGRDEYVVVTAGWDNMIKVWDINTGNFLQEFARDKDAHYSTDDDNDYIKYLVPHYGIIPPIDGQYLFGINTGELMRKIKLDDYRIWKRSAVIIGNTLIMGSDNGTVIILHIGVDEHSNALTVNWDTEFTLTGPQKHTNQVSSVDMTKNIIITGSWDCTAKIWDKHTGACLRTLAGPHGHIGEILAVAVYDNIVATVSSDETAKIWNVLNGTCLRTLAGPNGHTDCVTCVTLDDTYVITGSEDCTAKIWPLFPRLIKGKPETNPLLWIIHNTDRLQFDFMQRAYEKTINNKNFIIALPKKLGVIEDDETQEQKDGRIYFTLPCAVREYLRTRLNIRK